jgi:hypothetical protein
VIKTNSWGLNVLNDNELSQLINQTATSHLLDKLNNQKSGTLVLWQKIDRIQTQSLMDNIVILRDHLSLVFHRFINGLKGCNKVTISVNESTIEGFNPFYGSEEQEPYPLKNYESQIEVQPHIMPSFGQTKKNNPELYKKLAGTQGYSQSQGFYLFRSNRLISYATWWRIIPRQDSNQLVRIEIDISNDQDKFWGITITKSGFSVSPPPSIRRDLKILVQEITRRGRNAEGGRKKISNKVQTKFWDFVRNNDKQKSFVINKEHPLLDELRLEISDESFDMLKIYLKSLEAFLPIEDIYREKVHHPDELEQKINLDKTEMTTLIDGLLAKGLDKETIKRFIGSEGFDEEMFSNA